LIIRSLIRSLGLLILSIIIYISGDKFTTNMICGCYWGIEIDAIVDFIFL
jgi:hypothetical protein